MGDPKKAKRKYERPRMAWNKQDIGRRKEICEKYGLKNRQELWRTDAFLRKKKQVARGLLAMNAEERENHSRKLIESLVRIGLLKKDAGLNEVLALKTEDALERRLQTVVWRKGLSKTAKQARQLVVHGHIKVNGEKITVPGYKVKIGEENNIKYKEQGMELKITQETKSRGGKSE